MKFAYLVSLSLLTALSGAHADDGSPANVGSDYKTKNVDVRLDFTAGKIQVRDAQVEGGVGAYQNSATDGTGGSVSLKMRDKYVVNGTVTDSKSSGFLLLTPGASVRLDRKSKDQGGAERTLVEGDLVGFIHFQARAGHDTEKTREKAEAYSRQYVPAREKYIAAAEARSNAAARNETIKSCIRQNWDTWYTSCSAEIVAEFQRDAEKASAEIARLEKEIPGLEAKATKLQAEMDVIRGRAKAEGYAMREACENSLTTQDCFEPKKAEIHATGEFTAASVGGLYRNDNVLGYRQYGARIKIGEISFDAATRLNGVNINFCGAIAPLAFIAGKSEGRQGVEGMAKLCAGVETPVGHLGYSVTGTTDFNDMDAAYMKLENRADLKQIGGLPVGIYYTNERERSASGHDVRNMIGIQGTY